MQRAPGNVNVNLPSSEPPPSERISRRELFAWIAVAVLIVCLAADILSKTGWPWQGVIDRDPFAMTTAQLRMLENVVQIHRTQHGTWPSPGTWRSDVASILQDREPVVDGWGRELIYLLTDDGPMIYSIGPDGHDQRGSGDDVVIRLAGGESTGGASDDQ